jgi:hypothetical protein
MKGPIILIANLLTEGRGMLGFTAADAVTPDRRGRRAQDRRRHRQHEVAIAAGVEPLRPGTQGAAALGDLPAHCELVGGEFWTSDIARTIACVWPTPSGACCRSRLLVDD